jgi:biotin carboxyl carrier protein
MRFFASVDGERKEIEIEEKPNGFSVRIGGRPLDVDAAFLAGGLYLSLLVENDLYTVETEPGDLPGHWVARVHGRYLDVVVRSDLEERAAEEERVEGTAGRSVLRSPMPGLVVKIVAGPGADVRRGDPVAVVEAMKMQNELVADREGRVVEVHVAAGDRVDARTAIATIEGRS